MTDQAEPMGGRQQATVNELFAMFPRLFATQHNGQELLLSDPRAECPGAWLPILEALCESLQWETDENGAPQMVIHRVKEKMGSLRVQALGPRSERQAAMIELALRVSLRIPAGDR